MRFVLLAMLLAVPAVAQWNRVEDFDTSGMPRHPTTFVEQQIFDLIAHYRPGDLAEARRIQQKLGKYYAEKGDRRRANAALVAAEPPQADAPPPPAANPPAKPAPSGHAAFTGNYYGMDGRTLHTWEFHADGSFLHTWVASGAGTSVRSSERGSFQLAGSTLELRIWSNATAFATPGVGGRTTDIGGGGGGSTETRRVAMRFAEPNLILDGLELKPKSW